MELTSSVKEIYAQSEENIILTDAELNVIWKNHGDLPDVIDISAFMRYSGKTLSFCLLKRQLPLNTRAGLQTRRQCGLNR